VKDVGILFMKDGMNKGNTYMKTVLITGIAGFLGQNLCRALLKKGYEVSGVDDLSVGRVDWLPSEREVNFYSGDISMLENQSCYKFDYVIHLVSRKIPRYGGTTESLLKNTKASEVVTEFALRQGAKLIYLSSSDIYGKQSEFNEASDSIIGSPDIPRWSYAISKMWSEQLLYSTPKDFNFNIVRLFGSYGPYHALSWTAGPQSVFISQALKQEPITIHGNGNQKRCFQYVDDAVNGIISAMESDYNREVFNIGNPKESISINALARMIWDMVNPDKECQYKYIPHSTEKYEEVLERVPDISKARKLLGFEPSVSLFAGLKKTIEWQRKVVESHG